MKRQFLLCVGMMMLTWTASAQPVLSNGNFEEADPSHPGKTAHWDLTDGLGIQWAIVPGDAAHGKAIRMDTSVPETALVESYMKAGLTQWVFPHPKENAIAETYGLSLYSEAIPLITGKAYRVTFDYMAEKGTAGKLWFRAYGEANGEKKRVYEGTVDCNGGPTWKQYTGLFHPTRHTPNAVEFKIMLYAYYPAGVAWFDNIKVEALDDIEAPPPSTQ